MRLRPNEFCPIHKSLSCCGRETLPKSRLVRFGVQRVEDPHHPRVYRELRSAAEMRKLLNRKVRQQAGICAICHEKFTDYNDIVPDHKNPKGMGGPGETTTRTTSKRHIGGVTKKRDQPECRTDGRLTVSYLFSSRFARVVNDLPLLEFYGCDPKGVVTPFSLCPCLPTSFGVP